MALLQERTAETRVDTLVSINPGTLEVIDEVPLCPPEKVAEVIAKARKAFSTWSNAPYSARAEYLKKAKQYIYDNLDSLARRISEENGKTFTEAIAAEILPVIELTDYFIKHTPLILENEKINLGHWELFLGKKSYLHFAPLGVIGLISPWNYPFSIPMGEIVMSLLVGNTIILKPSEQTPLMGLMIEEIFKEAGLPEGVLNVINGYGDTGAALIQPGVNKIIFTGSVATGKKIMKAASEYLIPVVLELGGKDPMIVLPDADMDIASSAAVWCAFANSGQTCASVERLYIPEAVKKDFIDQVVAKTNKLRQGVGIQPNIDIGSMISLQQMNIVEDHVSDARENGASILTGGERNPELKGYFYRPTVLTEVDASFKIVRDETFGPVLPIMTYKTEEEAVELANNSPYGLTASIWGNDLEHAERLAQRMEAGTVTINDAMTTYALCQTPWGGVKQSGFGRTHGKYGLLELVHLQHIHIDKQKQKKFWWYPYGSDSLNILKGTINFFFSGDFGKRASALPRMLKEMVTSKKL